MGEMIRKKDWTSSPLGPVSDWPTLLLRSLRMLLDSKIPMFISWGPDLLCFYNDAYRPSLGNKGKHPSILGMPGREAWPELWNLLEPRINKVLAGESVYTEDECLSMFRNGKMEDTYWTSNYSPIKNDEGENEGILVVCIETTAKVDAFRKLEGESRKFREFVEAAPTPIGIYMGENLIVDTVNQSILKTWDKDESVIGKTFRNALPELEGQPFYEILENVYRTGIPYHTGNSKVDLLRNGKMQSFYFNFSYTPLKTSNGEVYGVLNTANDITELVLTQNKLEESERNFRNMILQSPVAMCILKGPEFIVEVVNPGVLKIWGKNLEDVIDKPVFEGVPEAREQGLEAVLKKVYETGETFVANELPISLLQDGKLEIKHVNFTYQPLIVEESVVAIMASAIDVTDQVNARKKSEETNRQFQFIANALPQKIWTAGKTGKIDYFNKVWIEYTGLTAGELKDNGWERVIHPDELQDYKRRWERSVATGEDFEIETKLLDKHGNFRWHLCRAMGLRNGDEGINLWIGSNTDIHLQKTHSIELENAVAQRTKELLLANESLQLKNQEIALSRYNKRFLTEFSDRFSAFNSNTEFFNSLVLYISDLTHMDFVLVGKLEEKQPGVYNVSTIALAANGKLETNYSCPLLNSPCEQVVRNFKYAFPENCRLLFPKHETTQHFGIEGYIGYPLFDNEGNPMGLISVLNTRPISDSETVSSILKIVAKRAEVELQRIKYEETLHQNNLMLEEKNHELELMNDELNSFAYVSSHDLQEPLRKIRIFCNRLMESERANLSPSGYDQFARIQNAALRMQTLIEDLLTYSRTNSAERVFERCSLDQLVAEVAEDMNELILESAAKVEFENLGQAKVIPFQFKQLLQNMITNSIKFSQPGQSPEIKITSKIIKGNKTFHPKLKPQINYVKITLKDNGIGFQTEYQDKIFEVFQRLHGKDSYPGTGIGLAIVKKIVENHNGAIVAEGKPEKGAAFHIYIPDN